MKFNVILTEAFKNIFTREEKEKYVDEVWDIFQEAYSYLEAGFLSFDSKEEMLDETFQWKLRFTDKKLVAVKVYKNNKGFRKSVATGSKDGYGYLAIEMALEDMKRSLFEISGKMETILIAKLPGGYKNEYIIPNTEVANLLKKDITLSDDGIHYSRMIGGSMHTKIMLGTYNDKRLEYEGKNENRKN